MLFPRVETRRKRQMEAPDRGPLRVGSTSGCERSIFGWVSHGVAKSGERRPGLFPTGNKCHLMQQHVSLYALQTGRSANDFAIVNGHRISIDVAQSSVHFYRGEQEWGRLAGSVPVEKWTGDWLIRSVGRFFRLDYQLSDNKTLSSIQRNGYLTTRTVHAIGNARLYERLLANSHWDYAISFRGEISFGTTVHEAVNELRTRLSARVTQEQATINLQLGPGSRFNQQQLNDFCQTNQLTVGGQYTQQELRQAVLRQRKVNCERFGDQLRYFNIRINCR